MSLPKEEYLNNWIYRAREDISVMENLAKAGIDYGSRFLGLFN
jgi:hypothetical protein